MRFKQLQRSGLVQTHYRLYKSGKNWFTALVLLIGSSAMGATLLTKPVAVHAATTPTTAVTSSSTTSTAAPSATSASSATSTAATASADSTTNPSATSTNVTTSITSAASAGSTTSTASTANANSTTSTATTNTGSMTSATSATSTHATTTTSTTSAATTTNTSTTTSAASVTSTGTSSAPVTSATSATSTATSANTAATSTTASTASTAANAVPDDTVVTFGDSGIEAAVQQSLGVTGPVTVGEIRNFKGSTFDVGSPYNILMVTGTLAGMQYLQYLPSTTSIVLETEYANANTDLTPLIPLHFSQLMVETDAMSEMNLAPLTKIDPSRLTQVLLDSSTNVFNFQANNLGMTNAQLAMLGPWLTAVDNNDAQTSNGFPKFFDIGNGQLTNFSPLKDFAKPATIAANGAHITVGPVVNLVIGQPAVFKPLPIIGVKGEDLTSHYETTWNGTDISKAEATETPLVSLGNDIFEIPTAYQALPNANWFAYGLLGSAYYTGNPADMIQVSYPGGVSFKYDVMVFQLANWQTAPSISASFIDRDTGQAIQPEITMTSPKIGDPFDLTRETTIPGYRFLTNLSSATTGTYSQNPQSAEFYFEKDAVVSGGLTVKYLDPDGTPIAPATQITGNVGTAYTVTPPDVANYTFKQIKSTSDALTGTLPLLKGTIVLEYAPVNVTRTINYLDTTTNKTLDTETITAPYQGTATNPTTAAIAAYEAQGYQLANNGYPAGSSAFDSATPTMTYLVTFTHQILTLKPGDNLPTGVILTHQVTQTINYHDANGKPVATSLIRHVTFERTALRDAVTGATTYTPWQPVDAASFSAVTVPQLSGYRADAVQIPAADVTAQSTDLSQTVTYTPIMGGVNVDYQQIHTDENLHPSLNLTGHVNSPYEVTAPAIANYYLANNQPASVTGTYTNPATTITFYYLPDWNTQPVAPKPTPTSQQPATTEKPVMAKQPAKIKQLVPLQTSQPVHYQVMPARVQIQLAPRKPSQPDSQVATALPQTSEQRPTDVWALLGLMAMLSLGVAGLRRHSQE